jgi:hypothetical protein
MHRHLALAIGGLIVATSASAVELPTRKAGLWELKMTFEGGNVPPQTMQHCVDAQTDKLMNANFGGAGRNSCTQKNVQVNGDTITIDSECLFGTIKSTSHAVVAGRFDQAYTVKVTSFLEGGPAKPGQPTRRERHMSIEAKWLGACKPGQRPGDIITSNGMKMNVLDMHMTPGRPQQ